MSSITLNNHRIEITNEDKILFPANGFTKMDLVNYYYKIAPYMIPHMKGRPISMQRFPEGIDHEGFYQKDAGSYFPTWIKTKAVKKEDGSDVHYVVCNNAATLVYLANQGCITPHLWLSKVDKLQNPDRMIFDLDPSGAPFTVVMQAARDLKRLLIGCDLTPFVMTTGSQGLHVVVPLLRKHNFAQVRTFSHHLAVILALARPEHYTLELRKEKRENRVFIDYLRNGFGATGVAPYAVRPLPGAPIATPLLWSEVNAGLTSQKYTLKTIFRRVARRGDPWHNIADYAGLLPRLEAE